MNVVPFAPDTMAQAHRRAYRTLIENTIGEDPTREGVLDTPDRAARAWQELTAGYAADLDVLMDATFDADGYDELVLLRGYPFHSLCEHHLLPFVGVAHVGYIPSARVLGLSKLGRLVDAYARRLQLQERLTVQVAEALEAYLNPTGVIVVIEARHLCMELRGVAKAGQQMQTSALRGAFKDKPEARAEAFALIGGSR